MLAVFQALLQVDKQSYDRLMAAEGIFVGYTYYNVFDAFGVNRWYKNAVPSTILRVRAKGKCLALSAAQTTRYNIVKLLTKFFAGFKICSTSKKFGCMEFVWINCRFSSF